MQHRISNRSSTIDGATTLSTKKGPCTDAGAFRLWSMCYFLAAFVAGAAFLAVVLVDA